MNHLAGFVCLTVLVATAGAYGGEIHEAAAAGDLPKVKALIQADPNLLESKDNNNHTPLMIACKTLQVEVANYLIDKGANVNAIGRVGVTPLFCFPSDKETPLDLVQRLVDKGADVNAKLRLNRNWTVLVEYVVRCNIRMAKFLIEHGADPSIRDIEGTPLHMAIHVKGREDMAAFLVKSGVKLQEFSFGNTELHLVAIRGLADLVPALIKRGADVNVTNDYGHTPLYYAARHGHRKAVEALIAAGADQSAIVETNYGKAPQLTESLKEGEAYLWYLAPKGSPNTGYAVKTRNNLLIFDARWISESPKAGLANGYINPNEPAGQKITVLIGYPNNLPDLPELAKQIPGTNFVLNFEPGVGDEENNDMPPYRLAEANESFSVDGIQVHTIPTASRLFGREGLGYLVEVDGMKVFHAGLHFSNNNSSNVAKFREEIDFLKPFGPIDIAILPIKDRHLESFAYEPYLHLIDQLAPKVIYLIGEELVTEEHRKCLEVLNARDVPVFYPDGGIAVGQRFHYKRD
jgi:ankyrin repeat protein